MVALPKQFQSEFQFLWTINQSQEVTSFFYIPCSSDRTGSLTRGFIGGAVGKKANALNAGTATDAFHVPRNFAMEYFSSATLTRLVAFCMRES
jgi:hypothetical protein